MKRIPLEACAVLSAALVLVIAPKPALAGDAPPPDAAEAAKPAAVPPGAPKRASVRRAPPPPAASPPEVSLTISPAPFPQPWTMRVENTGAVPLKLAADARLLALEVGPRGAAPKALVRCALPASMRPASDGARALVVPPKRAYADTFDPRLYCFGARAHAAMSAGAQVTARLGFPVAARASARARLRGPFAVAPIEGVEPQVSAAKEIVAAPVTLEAETALAPHAAATDAPGGASAFSIAMTPWKDAATGAEVDVRVTLTNTGPAPARLRLRPAALAFEISGPSGTARCAWDGAPGAPVRELMSTVAPRASATTSVLLSTLCPAGSFDDAGIYTVRVELDASRLTGEGATPAVTKAAEKLAFVRIHRARKPEPEARPKLQAP